MAGDGSRRRQPRGFTFLSPNTKINKREDALLPYTKRERKMGPENSPKSVEELR